MLHHLLKLQTKLNYHTHFEHDGAGVPSTTKPFKSPPGLSPANNLLTISSSYTKTADSTPTDDNFQAIPDGEIFLVLFGDGTQRRWQAGWHYKDRQSEENRL
jgi:hypothetical protein